MVSLVDIRDSGKKFDDRYLLVEKIGGGGFSEVWLAHDLNADLDVALKIYTPNGELDEDGKEDFRREFARLCDLNHSNIIHAIGFGIHNDELPYLAMSVCKNGSAKKLIGKADENQIWDFILQVASGLQYLHSHSITHRDIKPDNILINADNQYLIIDFGISVGTRNTLRKSTGNSAGCGTSWYMSVESWGIDSSDVHSRDIWALGAMLYEIITGNVPFGQFGGVTQKAQNGKIPPISVNVSEELKQLVYDCLLLNAWERPAACEIVKRAQNHIAGNTTNGPIRKNKQKVAVLTSIVAIAISCVFLYQFWDSKVKSEREREAIIRNDSIFNAKIMEAVALAEFEINKNDLISVDETVLREAAKIHNDAVCLCTSDTVKRLGEELWMSSQQLIDDTYRYLYMKKTEYQEMGAESASLSFEARSRMLDEYVTSRLKDSLSELLCK